MGAHRTADATVSASDANTVTPSDATVIPVTRALYIGTGGDVVVRMASGVTRTFKNTISGILPIQVDKVMAATTATDILALY